MNVLILSNSEWDDSNSFGSSFTSIFGNINEIKIANIYCRVGKPNTKTATLFFNITEKSLIKNLINSKKPSGKVIFQKNEINNENSNQNNKNFVNFIKKKRWIIFFWIREIIWNFGRWKSKELIMFIDDFKPDIIFLPIYYSVYLNKVGLFLKEYTNKPMVGYISDDNYSLRQFSYSPLFWIDRFIKRRWVKNSINNSEILYVISEIQKKDYDKIFNINCKLLYKGNYFNKKPDLKLIQKNITLSYTGNIGDGRYITLAIIGEALKNIYKTTKKKGVLNIYSQTVLTNKMKSLLLNNKHIVFHGCVNSSEIKDIHSKSDILVHVESLNKKERLQTRQSFSTKIVDYLASHRCILAVGWKKAASISYLKENNAAIIATSINEIENQLLNVFKNTKLIESYANRAWELGAKKHQIKTIQNNLIKDLHEVIKNSK